MSDKFRKVYKTLNESNSELISVIKSTAEILDRHFDFVKSREMSLAITNLEQAIMWATKAIVLEDEKNNGKPIIEIGINLKDD